MKKLLSLLLLMSAFLISCQDTPSATEAEQTAPASITKTDTLNPIYIGTYTKKEGHVDGQGKGIYTYHLDTETGKMKQLSVTEGIINPSFVTVSPNGRFLYAVSETGNDVDTTGYAYAYAIDPETKALKYLNRTPTHGLAPCHATVTPNGLLLIVANYVGGVVTVLPILTNGTLGPASDIVRLTGKGPNSRQEASHPHSVFLSKNGTFAYVPDLGTDKIMIYGVSYQTGELLPAKTPFVQLPGGSGPRHLTFHPYTSSLFVANELNNTVTAMTIDGVTGELTAYQTLSTLPDDFKGTNYAADIHIVPDGHLLYVSNRGHNSLAIFEITTENNLMVPMGYAPTLGDYPRNFMIGEKGRYLYVANQNSGNVVSFKIDPNNGQLKVVDDIPIPSAVCLQPGKIGVGRY